MYDTITPMRAYHFMTQKSVRPPAKKTVCGPLRTCTKICAHNDQQDVYLYSYGHPVRLGLTDCTNDPCLDGGCANVLLLVFVARPNMILLQWGGLERRKRARGMRVKNSLSSCKALGGTHCRDRARSSLRSLSFHYFLLFSLASCSSAYRSIILFSPRSNSNGCTFSCPSFLNKKYTYTYIIILCVVFDAPTIITIYRYPSARHRAQDNVIIYYCTISIQKTEKRARRGGDDLHRINTNRTYLSRRSAISVRSTMISSNNTASDVRVRPYTTVSSRAGSFVPFSGRTCARDGPRAKKIKKKIKTKK